MLCVYSRKYVYVLYADYGCSRKNLLGPVSHFVLHRHYIITREYVTERIKLTEIYYCVVHILYMYTILPYAAYLNTLLLYPDIRSTRQPSPAGDGVRKIGYDVLFPKRASGRVRFLCGNDVKLKNK